MLHVSPAALLAHLSAELTGAPGASSLACMRTWCWAMLASAVDCPISAIATDASAAPWAGVNAVSAGDTPGNGGLKVGPLSIPGTSVGPPTLPELARSRTSTGNKTMAAAVAAAVAGETVALETSAAGPDSAALREEGERRRRRGEAGPAQYCPLLSMAKRPRSPDMLRSRLSEMRETVEKLRSQKPIPKPSGTSFPLCPRTSTCTKPTPNAN